MTDRAWMLLKSGRRLDLLSPHPCAWTDEDLAIRLSRTCRWASDSQWDHPLSVAQHSLTVLHLRMQLAERPLTPADQLRELLHDADEGLLNFDAIKPIKPHLGDGYERVVMRLRRAIDTRYDLPKWARSDYEAHKHADRLTAASEACHVIGWSAADLRQTLGITLDPLIVDPLPSPPGLRSWEPWPAKLAASVFLELLEQLQREAAGITWGDGLRVIAMPPGRTEAVADDRPWEKPTSVLVEGGGQTVEGHIVTGVRSDDGEWDLDGMFTVETDDGELVRVTGYNCVTEIV